MHFRNAAPANNLTYFFAEKLPPGKAAPGEIGWELKNNCTPAPRMR